VVTTMFTLYHTVPCTALGESLCVLTLYICTPYHVVVERWVAFCTQKRDRMNKPKFSVLSPLTTALATRRCVPYVTMPRSLFSEIFFIRNDTNGGQWRHHPEREREKGSGREKEEKRASESEIEREFIACRWPRAGLVESSLP
jgi:hypothetical protein